jgi:hypothetical protein
MKRPELARVGSVNKWTNSTRGIATTGRLDLDYIGAQASQ